MNRGDRERVPNRTHTVGIKARVRSSKLYIHSSPNLAGRLGEVFVDMAKEGALERGLMHTIAKLISIAVQHGTPLEVIVDSMLHTKFEPAGPVYEHDRIKFCDSIVDLLARHLAIDFLGREDLAHVPGTQLPLPESENDDEPCRTCGAEYDHYGDGYDGECPDCADASNPEDPEEDEDPGEAGVRKPAGNGPDGGSVDPLEGYALASAAVG